MSSFLSAVPAIACRRAGNSSPLPGRHRGFDGPVFVGAEGFDLGFAVAHETQRHRLHAPGRLRARKLAPQHRRQREADEIVEGAARQIGFDQRPVDLARLCERGKDRLLGDGVEGHTFDVHAFLDGFLLLEDLEQMPGDGFAFAIRVGRQNELVGALYRFRDLANDLLGAAVDLPRHLEVLIGRHRAVLRRQVAHVSERGDHLIVASKVFIDGLGLRGRFHDNDVHFELSGLGWAGAKVVRRPLLIFHGEPGTRSSARVNAREHKTNSRIRDDLRAVSGPGSDAGTWVMNGRLSN